MQGTLLKKSDYLGSWRERQVAIENNALTWRGGQPGKFELDARCSVRVEDGVLIVARGEEQYKFKGVAGASVVDWHRAITGACAGVPQLKTQVAERDATIARLEQQLGQRAATNDALLQTNAALKDRVILQQRQAAKPAEVTTASTPR